MSAPRVPRILHAHSTFSLGGKEARCVRLINAFGPVARHSIVSAMPGELGARTGIDSDIAVDFPADAPSLTGRPGIVRYRALARWLAGFDLILTYNWGAMDAVMAHRLFAKRFSLPPLIHHEDGFNADEARRLKPARTLFRRVALGGARTLVVPSQRLAAIARRHWGAGGKLEVIANGIDVGAYASAPDAAAIPGFARAPGDLVIGTIAGLRAVKDLPTLVRALALLPDHVRLVIVGEGPERAAIETAARDAGVAARVHLAGFLPDPARYVGLFDIFALSSLSEQAPISLIEAMAAGLPVAATDVGDVAAMLPPANAALLVPPGDSAALAAMLARLVDDRTLRFALGQANRERARAAFDEATMIRRYARLYGAALGEPRIFDGAIVRLES